MAAKPRHGMHKTRFYKIWADIKSRCLNQNVASYKDYGQRGITINPEWMKFDSFMADMFDGYSDDLTIDRIDNELGYFKENCQWIPQSEQNFNQRQRKDNSTGKTGVSLRRDIGRYQAFIVVEKKKKHLGYFDSINDAARAREAAELAIYGQLKGH